MTQLVVALHAVMAVAAALSLAVAALAWRNRSNRSAALLGAVNVTIVVWLLGATASRLALSLGLAEAVFVYKLTYLGALFTPPLFLLFALEFTGRTHLVTRRTAALAFVVPSVSLLVLFLAEPLYWADTYRTANAAVFGIDRGPFYWPTILTGYATILAGVALIGRWAFRGSTELYRRQAVLVLAAVVAPVAGNLLYMTGASPTDLTPVGFTVSSLVFLWAVHRYRLSSVAPIARNVLVDNFRDGVFVLDADDRFVDVNPKGRQLLDVEDESVVGEPMQDVLADWPDVVDAFAGRYQDDVELSLRTRHGRRHFDVSISPVRDRRDAVVGRLFVVHDVTESRRRERELERQNDQLEQFASFLSHDLRNPLNVANGYVETARDTGDTSYLDEVERAHDRMESMIEEALTYTRQGQTIEETSPTQLADAAREAWSNVDTAGATLTVDTDAVVEADRDRLLRAFENCFRNSVDHGGPSVAVTVGDLEGAADDPEGFFVADDGPGIPESDRERVFETGYTSSADGSGFGLAILRTVVDAHGWDVAVTASADGGARFEVTGVVAARRRVGE